LTLLRQEIDWAFDFALASGWQQYRGKNGDDGDDHQQFDQGKAALKSWFRIHDPDVCDCVFKRFLGHTRIS